MPELNCFAMSEYNQRKGKHGGGDNLVIEQTVSEKKKGDYTFKMIVTRVSVIEANENATGF